MARRLHSTIIGGTLAATAAATAWLSSGTPAQAQYAPPPSGYPNDARGGPNGRYAPDSVEALVGHTREDLDRSYDGFRFSRHDRDRLNHAEKNLREFAEKWRHGRFDRGQLNDAIGNIQHVLDKNHMPPNARGAVDQDVNQLRELRDAFNRHELPPRF